MAAKTPQQAAQKWANNLAGAQQAITDGVNAVSVSPTTLAAAQAGAYQAGVANAVQSGKWQRGLQAVSLQQWQQATLKKGLPRIASGAQQAQPKMQAAMQTLLPHIQAGVASLPPRGGPAANRQRMIAFSDHMTQYRSQG